MNLRLYDAHNHLQDERLPTDREALLAACRQEDIVKMVVNGCCEADWPAVLELARRYPEVVPSFGYHPWYVKERSPNWQHALVHCLDQVPGAIGEIGLDHWLRNYEPADQDQVFVWQWRLAVERKLPVSVHCLQAWGRLLEILRAEPRLSPGFVLHSFGGPRELVGELAELGAYFSLPGYFAQERKVKQREAFRRVPPDRLLIETDAPDQLLPEARNRYPLTDKTSGKPINHPANLGSVYRFAAELFDTPVEILAQGVEENFLRLFGPLARRSACS